MRFTSLRSIRAAAVAATVVAVPLVQSLTLTPASASVADPLPASTRFYVPKVGIDAKHQIADLARAGRKQDANLIRTMVRTPQAVWFTRGTPASVRRDVRQVTQRAGKKTVPTLVAYKVPGRDCSQYSSGGAGSDAAYRAWADGFAAGLAKGRRVIV